MDVGIKLAEKYSLPQDIRDFITTHHGTGVTRYFYVKYKNEHPNDYVTIEIYDYTLEYCIIHFHLNKGLCWREIYTTLKLSGVKGLPELGKKKC